MPIFNADKDVNVRYNSLVNDTILFRFRIVAILGSVMYLIFSFLDREVYPTLVHPFF